MPAEYVSLTRNHSRGLSAARRSIFNYCQIDRGFDGVDDFFQWLRDITSPHPASSESPCNRQPVGSVPNKSEVDTGLASAASPSGTLPELQSVESLIEIASLH